jgi:hypothetical protein
MNPCSYTHLILTKAQKTYDGEETVSLTNIAGETDICFQKKKKKTETRSLSPCTSVNSKLIKDFNIRPESLELIQEKAGSKLGEIGIGKDFLNRTQLTEQL